ncbi:DUF1465 family protein [Erythrobacter litoralis]|uniref:DUF1465 family protein n=1 Tax=Erythrobacter litoralis TaxID=39960 RepID=UPI002435F869|nr:DUF1465 family protein [Erythrobacter litoralis]
MNEQIVETLYDEAIQLAEQVRAVFAYGPVGIDDAANDDVRIAMSIEGLRSTTRIMNILAWLLNQRAFFDGELSARQLRRRNVLGDDRPSDEASLAVLEPETRILIADTISLHARVSRLDTEWRQSAIEEDGPVHSMQDRIATAFDTV